MADLGVIPYTVPSGGGGGGGMGDLGVIAPVPPTVPSGGGGGGGLGGMVSGLQRNPYFSAGFGLAGLGAVVALLKKSAAKGGQLLRRHLFVSLEVPCRDPAYPWLLSYLGSRHLSAHHVSLDTSFSRSAAGKLSGIEFVVFMERMGGQTEALFGYVAGPGDHLIRHKGKFMSIKREREKTLVDQRGAPYETITLTALGRSGTVFEGLLKEAREKAALSEEGMTTVYQSTGMGWAPFGPPRRRRPIHSVVLDQGIGEDILHDMREFMGSSQWYIDRGIPHRRGYLLHGPPGCGKSTSASVVVKGSFIQAVAGEMEFGIAVLNLNERSLSDDRLAVLVSQVPPRTIILLEDIDAAFSKARGLKEDQRSYSVTLSGILNTLDGVAATEQRITFMTTNHINRLDDALIRPGRVDRIVEIGYATAHQARKMFLRFYPDQTELAGGGLRGDGLLCPYVYCDGGVEEFVRLIAPHRYSMADLQGHFLLHKTSAQSAACELPRQSRPPSLPDGGGGQLAG